MENLRAFFARWIDPQLLGDLVLLWGGRVLAALLVFFIGRIVARALTAWFRRAVRRVGMDETLSRFFGSVIYMVLLALIALTAVAALGVPTTNFIALVGAAGLAVGLALRDSLSNFASGAMLVFFRPFRVGDTVEAAGVSGSVESIGIFDTVIKSPDNRVITVPNSLIYGGTIVNATSEPVRRIDLAIPIGYHDDLVQAKNIIRGILAADDRVLAEPAPEVVLQDLVPTSVNIGVRAWVNTLQYAAARSELLERIKAALESQGMSLTHIPPPPPRVVSRAASSV